MFVFSRRTLQALINALHGVVSDDQLQRMVDRLNTPGLDRISASWELVWISALQSIGTVQHEKELPDGRKPDVDFSDTGSPDIRFIADVTAISDIGIEEANPVRVLSEEIVRFARRSGLPPNSFGYSVEARRDGRTGDRKTILLLPKKGEIIAVLKTRLPQFMREILDNNPQHHTVAFHSETYRFSVSYNARQMYMTGSFPSYSVPDSVQKNPLWNGLRMKAQQLKSAASVAPTGIIVCDGGCALMRQESYVAHGTVTASQVVQEFLRQHTSVSFVTLLRVQRENPMAFHSMMQGRLIVRPEIFIRDESAALIAISERIKRASLAIPQATLDPLNASIRCFSDDYGFGNFGAYQMSGNTIRIPSRTLQDFLAGRRTVADLNEANRWHSGDAHEGGLMNPFERFRLNGQMITNIEVVRGDDDDDWVTITFGAPDPAISPFRRTPG
ncbi:MAG: hypothetical protein ACK4FJ_06190 [Ferrovibrio sp.]|uniref:hypothetical protein n=1 Tax=Ferrovibrio sp. TaxID=1917215 RepID=UPI003919CF77